MTGVQTCALPIFQNGSFPSTTVRVTLKGGRQVEATLPFPKGHAQNPFTWEDVERTFRVGARAVGLSAEKTARYIELCRKIDQLDDMAQLAECLSL